MGSCEVLYGAIERMLVDCSNLQKAANHTFKVLEAGGFEVAVWEQTAQEGHMEHRLHAHKY
jgi:hypothetical protein